MVIDRIEGDVAVVELSAGNFKNVPLTDIEGHTRDGAVLVKRDTGYTVDEEATASRTSSVASRLNKLFKRV